jgi:hypothetical protein
MRLRSFQRHAAYNPRFSIIADLIAASLGRNELVNLADSSEVVHLGHGCICQCQHLTFHMIFQMRLDVPRDAADFDGDNVLALV